MLSIRQTSAPTHEMINRNHQWRIVFYAITWLLISITLLYAANWQSKSELEVQKRQFAQQIIKLTKVTEQIVTNKIQRIDETLLVLRETIRNDQTQLPNTAKLLRYGPLANAKLRVVQIDRNGYLSYTDATAAPSRLYVGDQAYFRFFADGGKDQLYIDEPRFGRITQQYTIPLVRPLFDDKGTFNGIIAISLDQEALGKFGNDLEESKDTTISIITKTGAIAGRSQSFSAAQRKSLPSHLTPYLLEGTSKALWDQAPNDDMPRLIVFQALKNLPLTIAAESYPREIIQEWEENRRLILGSASAAALLILILIIIFEQRRRAIDKYINTQQVHLREAQRLAEMGSWQLNLKTWRFEWSDQSNRLFCLPARQFAQNKEGLLLLAIDSDHAAIYAAIEKAISTGKSTVEYSILRGDGELRLIFARAEAVRNPAGIVTSLIGTIRDITEQRNAERALRLSEAKMRAIADNVTTVMFMKDTQGRYVFINRQYETLFHISNAEIQGKTDYDLFPPEHADAFKRNDQAVINTGHPIETEEMVPHEDGKHFYLSSKFPIRHETGEIYAICGIAVDITERKQAEIQANHLIRRNEVLMKNSMDGIHIINQDGQLQEANDAFCSLLGYTQNEIVLFNISSLTKTNKYFEKTIGEGYDVFETVFRCKDGHRIEVEVTTASIDFAGDKYIYATARDISERKHNQQKLEVLVYQRTAELQVALDVAKTAEKAKDAFLANITHELRTPLSAVIGFTGLALPLSTNPQQSAYLEKINVASKTLFNLINDLLDLSKISAGHMELEKSSFSLSKLISRCISTISYKIEENSLELTTKIDDKVPDIVFGDPLRIEQILLNLLSNAAKFTHMGKIELNFALQDMIDDRVCLYFEVNDTGIGMDETTISHLFTPFTQADSSIKRKFGGTGLGLSISKHLVELMGGKISANGRLGHGSSFQANIWLTLGNTHNQTTIELPTDRTTDTLPISYRNAHVLVVDDQVFNREIVEGLLAVVGITPYMATNGQDALEMLTYSGPSACDLVLMDIQMPILDGLSATRAIRNLPGYDQLPIVAMTAHTMAHERDSGREAGMNDHLGKPFDENEFYQILAKWLPKKKHGQAPLTDDRKNQKDAKTFPALTGINTEAGLALFLGDQSRYQHWLSKFIEDAPVFLAQIQESLSTAQPAQASSVAHTLKGRAGMLGMSELASLAGELEININAGLGADELEDDLIHLDRLERQLCAEISSGLSLTSTPQILIPSLPAALPEEPWPNEINELIARLKAGDGDCDLAMEHCQRTLNNTTWRPLLMLAMDHVQRFDYTAALQLFSAEKQRQG